MVTLQQCVYEISMPHAGKPFPRRVCKKTPESCVGEETGIRINMLGRRSSLSILTIDASNDWALGEKLSYRLLRAEDTSRQ